MSLDVYLTKRNAAVPTGSGIYTRENGRMREVSIEEWNRLNPDRPPIALLHEQSETDCVYSGNITHNLTGMADAAGIYKVLWRPEEVGVTKAEQLIEPLREGLLLLKQNPAFYKQYDAPNGWGRYEHFVEFVEEYLEAAKAYPDAEVEASR